MTNLSIGAPTRKTFAAKRVEIYAVVQIASRLSAMIDIATPLGVRPTQCKRDIVMVHPRLDIPSTLGAPGYQTKP